MKPITRILCPVDFSEQSLRVLDSAIQLAQQLGAAVVVMHAYEPPALYAVGGVPADPEAFSRIAGDAQGRLRALIEARAAAGVALEPLLRCGTPWREIDAAADEVGADLIVIAAHDRHGLQALFGGHVASKVAATSSKSVLTLREPGLTASW
jgi:nucleotide-binding universal stress UspA family protein